MRCGPSEELNVFVTVESRDVNKIARGGNTVQLCKLTVAVYQRLKSVSNGKV